MKLPRKSLPKRVEAKGTLEDYYKKLGKMGYLQVGAGFYSRALSNGTQVIKVAVDDTGYDEYLKYVLANQNNPYFPKVYNVKRFKNVWRNQEQKDHPVAPWGERMSHNVTVITMEKLTKAGRKGNVLSTRYQRDWNKPKAENEQEQRMFDVLEKLDERYCIDMHSKNVMLRGDQPVVIDPVVA